jgi:SAM-dependent methyltransferase
VKSESTEWFDDDSFWRSHLPFLFRDSVLDSAPEQVDRILEKTGLTGGEEVLDLCCGPGRHSLELASRGYRVTGVDRTALYLDRLSRTAAESGLSIELVNSDMREFIRENSFDLVLSMYTSFGYFRDIEDDLRVATNVYASLREGGYFLLELMGKEVLARIYQERGWTEENGIYHLEERTVTEDWSWMVNRWILIAPGEEPREFTVEHRLYSAAELTDLLRRAGFAALEVFGSLDWISYDQKATRLVVLARKTG